MTFTTEQMHYMETTPVSREGLAKVGLPEDASLQVIVDGVLAFIFGDALEKCGLDLTTYFTYRFHPPSKEFQEKLDKFESLIRKAC